MNIRLTQSQSQVVEHDEGALLVVAGPGSGKTRVLTERIKRLLRLEGQHFRILGLTFTNKAANEMRERLQYVPGVSDRTFIGTLHSFCTEVLATRGKSVGIIGLPNIFDSFGDRRRVLQAAIDSLPDIKEEVMETPDVRETGRRIDGWLKDIGEHKNNLILPEMVQDDKFRRLYEEYNSQLRACNAVDFDDLLLLTYNLFEERPAIAAFYRRQYRYICIDEAQDLNEAQYRLLCALCGSEYYNVIMVGDPKQAIFMWNGAHPKYMDLFERDFRAVKIELQENFRSARNIVEAAKTLDAKYKVAGVLAIEGLVQITACEDETKEAEYVYGSIKRLIENGHPDVEGDITFERCAVIGRNRFVFRELQELLKSENVPFCRKISSSGVQSESDVVGSFEMALRVLANPLDRLHLGLLLERWGVKKSVEEVYADADLRTLTGEELLLSIQEDCSNCSSSIFSALASLPKLPHSFRLTPALDSLEDSASALSPEERALVLEDVKEWRKQWDYCVRAAPGGGCTISGFLSQVALGTTQQPQQEGVSLLTVHSSKGMEFDVVFVIAMTEGTFPDFRAAGSQLEEERRNAFVAVTRSRRLLYISYPLVKLMPWGDVRRQQPSRFIDDLGSTRV